MKDLLKVGDKVRITSNLNQLNRFMYQYADKEAIVEEIKEGIFGGQIAFLDIDSKHWAWSYQDKLSQIKKC